MPRILIQTRIGCLPNRLIITKHGLNRVFRFDENIHWCRVRDKKINSHTGFLHVPWPLRVECQAYQQPYRVPARGCLTYDNNHQKVVHHDDDGINAQDGERKLHSHDFMAIRNTGPTYVDREFCNFYGSLHLVDMK